MVPFIIIIAKMAIFAKKLILSDVNPPLVAVELPQMDCRF